MGEPALDGRTARRSSDHTPEPAGAGPEAHDERRWVVQQHAARRLHYDLRLQAGGVLISWAVPKGPSYDPSVKRLAVKVEDHRLEYRDFEGAIPGGNYGAGGVIIWDEGTYSDLTTLAGRVVPLAEAVAAGHASFWLEGTKLAGGWSLTRFDGANWALVKRHDDRAASGRDVVSEQPRSVRTGRTLEEVLSSGDGPSPSPPAIASLGTPMAAAGFLDPMLARTELNGPTGRPAVLLDRAGQWLYEPKLDGLRCVAVRNGADMTLWSRNRLSFNARFPSVVEALRRLPATNFVIDAEVVGMVGGRSDFAALQQGKVHVQLWAFDLPWLLGQDLRHLAIEERKVLLGKTVAEGPELRWSSPWKAPGEVFETACQEGWEGLVAKRAGSALPGGRSPDWRKLKCGCRQEFVVGRVHGPAAAYPGRVRGAVVRLLGRGAWLTQARSAPASAASELRELCRELGAWIEVVPLSAPGPGLIGALGRARDGSGGRFSNWTPEGVSVTLGSSRPPGQGGGDVARP